MTRGFGEERQAVFEDPSATDGTRSAASGAPTAKLRIGPGGRVVIPAAMREKLGVKEGDTLIAAIEEGELRFITMVEAVKRAQALVRQSIPEGVSLVDELIAERRREFERELKGE